MTGDAISLGLSARSMPCFQSLYHPTPNARQNGRNSHYSTFHPTACFAMNDFSCTLARSIFEKADQRIKNQGRHGSKTDSRDGPNGHQPVGKADVICPCREGSEVSLSPAFIMRARRARRAAQTWLLDINELGNVLSVSFRGIQMHV